MQFVLTTDCIAFLFNGSERSEFSLPKFVFYRVLYCFIPLIMIYYQLWYAVFGISAAYQNITLFKEETMQKFAKNLLYTVLILTLLCATMVVTVMAEETETYVAAIGDEKFSTLADAVESAGEGDTIVLLEDVTLESTVRIYAGDVITLDLNGKTIDFNPDVWVYGAANSGVGLLTVRYGGDLTIIDSSEDQSGTILADADADDVYCAVMMTEKGDDAANGTAKLTVKGGNLIGSYYAITGNSARDDTEITIDGGYFTGNAPEGTGDCAIYHPMDGKLTINGGKFVGMDGISINSGTLIITGGEFIADAESENMDEEGYWDNNFGACTGDAVQIISRENSNSAYQNPTVSISGGTFVSINGAAVTSYAGYKGETPDTAATGFITGGNFSSDPSEYLAYGYSVVENEDTTYTVVALDPVAQIGDDVFYTLADAVKAAGEGDTITMLASIQLVDTGITVTADQVITLDLNGYTLSGVENAASSTALIANNGTLTITDTSEAQTGKITTQAINPDTEWAAGFPAYANNTITNRGSLIIEGGRIENTTEGGACYVVDQMAGSLVVNGGELTHVANANIAIRQWSTSTTAENSITINGGTVSGKRAIWIQLPSNKPAEAPLTSITVNGGTLSGARYTDSSGDEYYLAIYSYTYGYSFENTAIIINAGTFYGDIALTGGTNKTVAETVEIKGGIFVDGDVYSYAEESVAAETITISDKAIFAEAKIGEVYYPSLADAMSAVKDGETITLTRDVELDKTISFSKDITFTLDGQGYTISPAEGATITDSAFNMGQGNDSTRATKNYTIKDVVFDGWSTNHVVRLQGVTAVIESCTFQNCTQSGGLGILTLTFTDAKVYSCTFIQNTCIKAIDVNSWGDGSQSNVTIDRCDFMSNTCNGAGVVYYSEGGSCSVTNCKFIGNDVTHSQNAATLYMGFNENVTVTGCLFNLNNVVDQSTGTRVAGAIFFGYEANVTGNAFEINTATNANGTKFGQVCVSTYYNCTIDLSGNFWGGEMPVIGVDYTVQHQTGNATFALNDYYTEYSIETGDLVLSNKVDAEYAAQIGKFFYATLADAVAAVKDGETITILSGTISEGTIKLPASLNNVTFKGEEGAILKDMTIMAYDGTTINYQGLTFDGITFENSRISITGWRTGEVVVKDLTVKNCVFQNLDDTTNSAPVHINMAETEPVVNFTFTNNVINNITGGSKSGVYAQTSGNTIITDNVINNVSFRPYVIQITTDDDIADEFIVTRNTFSGSAAGRAQGLGNNSEGSDAVNIVVTENIFKDITSAQQICYWNFNPETTTADLSHNYYDINIEENANRIYFNSAAADRTDLYLLGIYPYYAALNEDGTIDEDSLVQVPDDIFVAAIGDEKFLTLADAIDAAADSDTIKLMSNITVESVITVDKAITIDLNGYTIDNGDANINIFETSADVTIKNGSITGARKTTSNGLVKVNSGKLTMNGVTVVNTAMNAIRIQSGASAELIDCTMTGKINAVGVAEIKGGTYYGLEGSESITSKVVIYSGTFHFEISKANCLEGWMPKDNGDGTWTVVEMPYVAEVNGVKYKTIKAALDAANAGDTITLIADYTGEGLVINKSVTIDLGGFTYTLNTSVGSSGTETNGLQILQESGNVTIKNGTIAMEPDKDGDSYTFFILIQNYADLTLDSVTLDCTNGVIPEDYCFRALTVNDGTTNLTGSTSIINSNVEGYIAIHVNDLPALEGGAKVNIETTGTIEGSIVTDGDDTGLAIIGGYFTSEVSKEWLADGYVCLEDDDMYLVVNKETYHIMTYHAPEAPSCTENGLVEYWSCSVCGKNFSDEDGNNVIDDVIDYAKGHKWGASVLTGGKYVYTCGVCGDHDYKLFTGWLKENGVWSYYVESVILTGWQQIEDKWYYMDANGAMQTGWLALNNSKFYLGENGAMAIGLTKIEGSYYFFDENGAMKTGWVEIDGVRHMFGIDGAAATGWYKTADEWYYLEGIGTPVTGWQDIDGARYYMNAEGVMLKGWITVEDKWYYMNDMGVMQTGWLELDGNKFYTDENGVMATGLSAIDGEFYYFAEDGAMKTGWIEIDGVRHMFGIDGAAVTGWYKTGNEWYYFKGIGVPATGWLKIGESWYYMDENGVMQTGWVVIDGERRYFNENGVAVTAWVKDNGNWYYLSNGAITTGWQKIGSYWYYMDANGVMQTGWEKINGKWYYMDATGAMQTGWEKINGKWYYMDATGAMQTGWIKLNGSWYYLSESGAMLTGTHTINGKTYTFNASGVWVA